MHDTAVKQAVDSSAALLREGRFAEAETVARRAVALNSEHLPAVVAVVNACRRQGKLAEAIAAANRTIELQPANPDLHADLAMFLIQRKDAGDIRSAVEACREALGHDPQHTKALLRLGTAYQELGELDSAVRTFEKLIATNPTYPAGHHALASALRQSRQHDRAFLHYARALELRPNYPVALVNWAEALRDVGRTEDAIGRLRDALRLEPTNARGWATLSSALHDLMRYEEAVSAAVTGAGADPKLAVAHNCLGNALNMLGRIPEASAAYRRAIELNPRDAQAHSNYCFHTNYDATVSDEQVLAIHMEWDRAHSPPTDAAGESTRVGPHGNERAADRKLRVAYVSHDFRQHAVGHFFLPAIAHHDHTQFEVICYSTAVRTDDITRRIRALADGWREIGGMGDDQSEAAIRADEIDILVDLAGHTAGNRLKLFARRPAPVQVSMIGYPCTTGLRAMDHKISDARCDPAGAERFFTEKLARLEGSFWCFDPGDDREPVGPLPALRNGFVTFGSTNNLAKAGPDVLDLWARVVSRVPRARVRLQHAAMTQPSVQERVLQSFGRQGVEADRVLFTGWTDMAEYDRLIREIDMALDPFPFNGGTTTCHQLYQGVPCVTLAGTRQVSRMGVSMLHSVGLTELIAASQDEYVQRAADLANDLPRLASVRAGLRERMMSSPLGDGSRYTRELEASFRSMWVEWCRAG